MKLFITCFLAFGQMASAADWIMGDDTCGELDRSIPVTSSKHVQQIHGMPVCEQQ
jgi:hypothetical protein